MPQKQVEYYFKLDVAKELAMVENNAKRREIRRYFIDIDANVCESHMNRVDVLEKVKGLLLLPNLDMATTQQVADFYEVGHEAIKAIVRIHKDELQKDGYKVVSGTEVKNLVSCKTHPPKFVTKRGHFLIETSEGFTKMSHNTNGLFPRRAILRVGMLLRDSAIAKEVRLTLRVIALCDCD